MRTVVWAGKTYSNPQSQGPLDLHIVLSLSRMSTLSHSFIPTSYDSTLLELWAVDGGSQEPSYQTSPDST